MRYMYYYIESSNVWPHNSVAYVGFCRPEHTQKFANPHQLCIFFLNLIWDCSLITWCLLAKFCSSVVCGEALDYALRYAKIMCIFFVEIILWFSEYFTLKGDKFWKIKYFVLQCYTFSDMRCVVFVTCFFFYILELARSMKCYLTLWKWFGFTFDFALSCAARSHSPRSHSPRYATATT